MQVTIYQGSKAPPAIANITIVIDVIRAFTVAHHAFLQGVRQIFLASTIAQARQIKKENPDYLLAGEIKNGLPIAGFDLDNSPHHMQQKNLSGKTLVQKTTNGVRATLNCLSSNHIFVTGFTNAKNTAAFVREKIQGDRRKTVNIIASHSSGDDDLACGEYIKSILEDSNTISIQEVKNRIKQSHVAEKFFDEDNAAFIREDVLHCAAERNTDFVMKVNKAGKIPMIERIAI
jgi:2-phosphosulfolactate phosphatase